MSLSLQLEMLDEQGYVLIPDVLEPLRIALLRCAIDDLQPIHWDYQGLLEHYKCVFNRNPMWLPFLDLPPLIALAEAALGTDCHVIGQTAWRSHPGYPGMPLHLDHLPMQLPGWLRERGDFTQPAQILTAQLYLSEIDHSLGPTWIVPGSHHAARPPQAGENHWQGCEAVPVLCKAGDALVFRSDVWHSGGGQLQPGPSARHAASALRPAHGRAEVFAVLELAFQPAGAGARHIPATAPAGRTRRGGIRLKPCARQGTS